MAGMIVSNVAPPLAEKIILAHIDNKRQELADASVDALRELEHRP